MPFVILYRGTETPAETKADVVFTLLMIGQIVGYDQHVDIEQIFDRDAALLVAGRGIPGCFDGA